ncbi:hypothetical protein EV401DRAFT_1934599 [Pisolithus croceorrhizus]|nr:hypothetical protein EV401DRAFT_1934599 [Pisolithus croceorrhizus]
MLALAIVPLFFVCGCVLLWNRPNDAIPSALPQKIEYHYQAPSGWNSPAKTNPGSSTLPRGAGCGTSPQTISSDEPIPLQFDSLTSGHSGRLVYWLTGAFLPLTV